MAPVTSLPILQCKDVFTSAFSTSSPILIYDYAGSGASTKIPQWAVELAKGKPVVAALPRRLAAVSLATQVAEEMGVEMGKEVGYANRNEEKGGSALKFCTDGWLLRAMEKSPCLDEFGVVIVDGIHERTLHVYVLISKMKQLSTMRANLKLVLIGSHLDLEKWSAYLGHCFIINAPRPASPEFVYSPLSSRPPIEAAIETVVGVVGAEKEGNLLLLLATKDEVEKACEEIGKRVDGLVCIPLHSGMAFDQLKKLSSEQGRKCIVSTSIGDSTAFFLNGDVAIVIDSGRCQSDFYDDEQSVMTISKMAAIRRAERSGVRKVVRLYSEKEFEEMEMESVPVILRMDPARVKEVLKGSGIDVETLDLIDKPSSR